MLQKTRELLVLALIVVLPFHALLVTAGTRLLAGVGRVPLPWLAGWKEILLVVVLGIAILEICYSLLVTRYSLRVDILDWLIIGLLVLGVSVSATHYSPFGLELMAERPLTIPFFFGFKYTLFPLFLFLVLRRVPWSGRFTLLVTRYSLLVGAIIGGYGIFTLFLPESFFTLLGYSDLHSLYLPDGPLAAFQYLEGTGVRRMQATFAGPNQLGMWLLIPWSVAVMMCVKHWRCVMASSSNHDTRVSHFDGLSVTRAFFVLALISVAVVFIFSRAAWIGAVVILLVALWHNFSPYARCWLLVAGFSFLAALVALGAITRPQSTAEHFRRPLQALQIIARHPFGLGLGSVGPAANRTGDPCVYLEEGADPSWAKDRPNLCVFVGDRQVQPFDSAQGKPIPCRCPFLPENWYLQVGVELGLLGFLLFVTLVVLIIKKLIFNFSFLLPFMGVSVAAIFLHAWEDSAVAYTVWMLIAAALPSFNHRLSSPSTIVR